MINQKKFVSIENNFYNTCTYTCAFQDRPEGSVAPAFKV